MSKFIIWSIVIALGCLILIRPVTAQEKRPEASTKVVLENERVRVLDVRIPPGAQIPMRPRPDRVLYFKQGGKERNAFPDGTTREVESRNGEVRYEKADTRAIENIGATEIQVHSVNLK